MALQFNDTTNKNGIIQQLEQALSFNDGDISGNATRLAMFTGDINLGVDEVTAMILSADRSRQIDDYNHTKYPIITIDVVSGQRDYSFTQDEQLNLIVHIHKVMCADSSGVLKDLQAVNQQDSGTANDSFNDGNATAGVPYRYDKTADGIFLDPIPNYASTAGLKIFIDREASHFTVSDTTKKAGFMSLFHEYLVLKPAYRYARDKSLPNATALKRDMLEMRQYITDHIQRNQSSVKQGLRVNQQFNR